MKLYFANRRTKQNEQETFGSGETGSKRACKEDSGGGERTAQERRPGVAVLLAAPVFQESGD